jgi:hypothetical protein
VYPDFPDWVHNEINNKHSLRSNIKGYGGKTHYTDSQNSDTTAPSGRELYHLQFSLQAASPGTFGYTLVSCTCHRFVVHFTPTINFTTLTISIYLDIWTAIFYFQNISIPELYYLKLSQRINLLKSCQAVSRVKWSKETNVSGSIPVPIFRDQMPLFVKGTKKSKKLKDLCIAQQPY